MSISQKYNYWFESETKIPSNINFQKIFSNNIPTVASIIGDVQGGKTNISLKLAHKCILHSRPVIMIILDRDVGKLQIQNRLKLYNKQFEKWCVRNELEFKPMKYLFIKDCKDPVKISEYLEKDIVISYINQPQLSVLLPLIKNDFFLLTDEADYAYKENDCKVSETYYKICGLAKFHLGITATSFKFWYKEHKVCCDLTFKLERHQYYKGIDDVSFENEIDNSVYTPSQETDCLEADEGFKTFLNQVESQGVFENINTETGESYKQPPIVLYVPSSYTKHHTEIFKYIKRTLKRRTKWIVIQYDGHNGCPIKLYCSDFEGKYRIKKNVYSPSKNGEYYIHNNTLQDVLGSLRRIMYSNDFFKNILIVAGRLASRQVSYVCDQYLWHLSHLRILRSLSTSCTELVQSMRIFGIFKDDMKLSLSCRRRDYEDIKKYIYFQNHVIQRVKSEDKYPTMYEGTFGDESISFEKRLLPKARLDRYIDKSEIKTEKIMKQMNIEKQIQYIRSRLNKNNKANIGKFINRIAIRVKYTQEQLIKLLQKSGYKCAEWQLKTKLLKDTEEVPGRLFDTLAGGKYMVRKELEVAWQ